MNRQNKPETAKEDERVSLAGYLLVASPEMADPVFSHTVCLVVEHTAKHAIGVVLNKPMTLDPKPLWTELFQSGSKPEVTLSHFNFGGPKSGPILAIHSDSSLAEGGNNQGVYLSAQVETLRKLASTTPAHMRWIIGHANWGPSQLETEIVDGAWRLVPATPNLVFANETEMWEDAIRWIGRSIIHDITGIENFPSSPMLN